MSLTVSANYNSEYDYSSRTSTNSSSPVSIYNVNEPQQPKAAEVDKDELKRNQLIEKYKDKYDIKKGQVKSYTLSQKAGHDVYVEVYFITAKKDVNLARLKEDLKIENGVISANNDGYGQYDNNGHYIENKAMKGVKIHIPVKALGADKSVWESICDWFSNL